MSLSMSPQDCNITDATRAERSYLFREPQPPAAAKSAGTTAEQPSDAHRKRRRMWKKQPPAAAKSAGTTAEQPSDAHRKRRRICKEKRPFGGLNVIMTGDFWQLPPVKQTAVFCSPFGGNHSSQAQRVLNMFWQREADSINCAVELTQDSLQQTIG
jgi:hypothetical protein